MEKILSIDGKQVPFKGTGAFLLRYRAQFNRDALQDIYKITEAFDENTGEITNVEQMDLLPFYDLIWVLAKTADPEIPEPFDWLDSFGEFPVAEILPELLHMITSCLGSTVKSKKK